MQPRKKFDISKTTTGQLYKYYTASVILKALYKTYHTLDPKYWAVNCGLALAQPVSSLTGSSTLAAATGYAALGVSFVISPFTTAASFASNVIADQIIQVGWENLPEWCNDNKLVEECFALAYVAKTEAIAYQINKYEEKRNQEESDNSKNQAESEVEKQQVENKKQSTEPVVEESRKSEHPAQPVSQVPPAQTVPPPTRPAQQEVVNAKIDDLHAKGYRIYKHGHGKHGNGKTIGAHMNPQAAKAWIEQGGTIECKKGGDKQWFSVPQEVQQAQSNQPALSLMQQSQAANVIPQPLQKSIPSSGQADVIRQMETMHSDGYRLYKFGHGKHGNGKTIGAHMSVQEAKSWIEQGGTIECKKNGDKHWFSKPNEVSHTQSKAEALPFTQSSEQTNALHQTLTTSITSGQSDVIRQMESLHSNGYKLYKHGHGKHGNGKTIGAHMSLQDAKSWIEMGGTVECKNGKSKHWFSKPQQNQQMPVSHNVPKHQQQTESNLAASYQTYSKPLLMPSAQSEMIQQIETLCGKGYQLYKHGFSKYEDGSANDSQLNINDAKDWLEKGGTILCKNGKSKHWFTKQDEPEPKQVLEHREETQGSRQIENDHGGIIAYFGYLLFGNSSREDSLNTSPSEPSVESEQLESSVEDEENVIDEDINTDPKREPEQESVPDPRTSIDPIHNVDRKQILIVRLTELEEVVGHYALISRRVRHGIFAGELPANLRDIASIMNRMKQRDCLLRDALRNIIELSMDNGPILNAAKNCLSLIDGGVIQPDKRYPFSMKEANDDDVSQEKEEIFQRKKRD